MVIKKQLITKSECARMLGVSAALICKGCQTGRFKVHKKDGKEMVNFFECRNAYIHTRTQGRKTVGGGFSDRLKAHDNSSPVVGEEQIEEEQIGDVPVVDNMFDLHGIRLISERLKVQKEQLNLDIARKKYVLLSEVKKEFMNIAETLKKSILAIPDRLAPLLASESDMHTIRQMLIVELKQSLTGIVKSQLIKDGENEIIELEKETHEA